MVYLHNYQLSNLEGRLLTLVETLGLPKSQEDAFKSYVRREVWETWDNSYLIPQSIKEQIYKSDEVVQVLLAHMPGSGSTKPKRK
jgi:hypothetical protein